MDRGAWQAIVRGITKESGNTKRLDRNNNKPADTCARADPLCAGLTVTRGWRPLLLPSIFFLVPEMTKGRQVTGGSLARVFTESPGDARRLHSPGP